MRLAPTLALVALLLAACHAPRPASVELDVRRALDALVAADNRRDLEFVVQSYCEDVELVPSNGNVVRGREAVRARYAELFAAWRPELRVEHHETQVQGMRAHDRGRTIGALHATSGDAVKPVEDEYEADLRLEDGRWRVERLSWRPVQREPGS
jgi:uncharacterized protein (TIGR02246 family)